MRSKKRILVRVRIFAGEPVSMMPDPPSAGPAETIPSIDPPKPVRDLDRIRQFPFVVAAAPWGEMDRDFILACWELLKGQAAEELGPTHVKSLEMLGIFPQVDMGWVARTGFDPVRRELHLYPRRPDDPRGCAPDVCAIIVGTIQGTGRLLQAVLSLPSESD
jgi:hypothetical protein